MSTIPKDEEYLGKEYGNQFERLVFWATHGGWRYCDGLKNCGNEPILKMSHFNNVVKNILKEVPQLATDGREELEKENEVKGLLFRVAPTPYQDPTIFYIKDVKDVEVDVAWQDIHGRGERITKYVLSDVQNKLKFGTWIKVDSISEITALQSSLKEKEKLIEDLKLELHVSQMGWADALKKLKSK